MIQRLSVLAVIAAAVCACRGDEPKTDAPTGGENGAGDAPERAEPVSPRAPEGDAIEYTLRFPAPDTHYAEVEAVFPAPGESVELMTAVWTPGSYKVRDYAKHIDAVAAATPDGDPLTARKTRKNRWRVSAADTDRVVIRYRLYGHVMSVRTNFIDAGFAMMNGAPTFVTLAEGDHPHDILLEPAKGWPDVATALPPHPSGDAHRYLAPDFDTVVDSPILMGTADRHAFDAGGVPHELVHVGATGQWDGPRSAEDVEKLVRAHIEFWGDVPYERYTFLNLLIPGGYGGLEHRDSTLMTGGQWAMRKREDYLSWLGLASHEFFHTWNVKRLYPEALAEFDYERETYTRALWIVEGITSYYDDVLLVRAGLMDRDEYLDKLSRNIDRVQTTPGRLVQPLSQASYDAWIKFYQRDENTANTAISYYSKGAVVAFLLDARIREATFGRKSLDDVMRLAYDRFASGGYTPEAFRALAAEVAGTDLDAFFTRAVDRAAELDYGPALGYYGLRFAEEPGDAAEKSADEAGHLGARTSSGSGRITVDRVVRDTPAYAAGISAGDEILAIDGYRVAPGELSSRLERYDPGDEVTVLVARLQKLRRIPVTLGEPPGDPWQVEVAPSATGSQKAHLDALLATD